MDPISNANSSVNAWTILLAKMLGTEIPMPESAPTTGIQSDSVDEDVQIQLEPKAVEGDLKTKIPDASATIETPTSESSDSEKSAEDATQDLSDADATTEAEQKPAEQEVQDKKTETSATEEGVDAKTESETETKADEQIKAEAEGVTESKVDSSESTSDIKETTAAEKSVSDDSKSTTSNGEYGSVEFMASVLKLNDPSIYDFKLDDKGRVTSWSLKGSDAAIYNVTYNDNDTFTINSTIIKSEVHTYNASGEEVEYNAGAASSIKSSDESSSSTEETSSTSKTTEKKTLDTEKSGSFEYIKDALELLGINLSLSNVLCNYDENGKLTEIYPNSNLGGTPVFCCSIKYNDDGSIEIKSAGNGSDKTLAAGETCKVNSDGSIKVTKLDGTEKEYNTGDESETKSADTESTKDTDAQSKTVSDGDLGSLPFITKALGLNDSSIYDFTFDDKGRVVSWALQGTEDAINKVVYNSDGTFTVKSQVITSSKNTYDKDGNLVK